MTQHVPMLDEDLKGTAISNRVIDEPHSLSNRPTRSFAPKLGPFYAESAIVMDGATRLVRGQDYQFVELHQELTLKTGKEVCSVGLIINPNVSSDIIVTYQAVGGHYQYSDEPISNLYQSVINDNRPVDWINDVFNKPTEYNPTVHRHLLDDIYGFEPVVNQLERLKRAVTLGQTSIVLEIVGSLLSKFKCKELPKVLPSNKLIQYDALLFFLSRRKILNDIWIDKPACRWIKGQNGILQIDTSGYEEGTPLYWQFYKQNDEAVALFTVKDGWITANGGIVEVHVYIPSDHLIRDNNLYAGVKEHPEDEDFKAVTYVIDIDEPVMTTAAYAYMLGSMTEASRREELTISEADASDERRLYYFLSNY